MPQIWLKDGSVLETTPKQQEAIGMMIILSTTSLDKDPRVIKLNGRKFQLRDLATREEIEQLSQQSLELKVPYAQSTGKSKPHRGRKNVDSLS